MRKKRVSIIDIARELNISPSTVSRALRDESRISAATRQSVKALANQLGYRPNLQARSLLNHRTYTVGLIVPDFTHSFFATVLSGAESILTEAGFQLMICTSNGSSEKEKEAANLLGDARVDGLLVSYARETVDFSHFKRLQGEGTPVLFFDRTCEDLEANYVITDDFQGATLAIDHLVEVGCQRIAHIKGPEHISTTFNRYLGYREAMGKHQLPINPDWTFQADDDKGQRLLDRNRISQTLAELDGIFAFNDYIAYEVVQLIHDVGLRIPKDIAIVGFGDDSFGTYLTPSLSTIYQPAREMGELSAKLLLNQIFSNPDHYQAQTHILDTHLIARASTDRGK